MMLSVKSASQKGVNKWCWVSLLMWSNSESSEQLCALVDVVPFYRWATKALKVPMSAQVSL